MQFIRVSVVTIVHVILFLSSVLSWDFSFSILLGRISIMSLLLFVVDMRFFSFSWIVPKLKVLTILYIAVVFFFMYENVGSRISFEINYLYTTTVYGTNRGEAKNEMTLKNKQWWVLPSSISLTISARIEMHM
jgi:hypothetical protein